MKAERDLHVHRIDLGSSMRWVIVRETTGLCAKKGRCHHIDPRVLVEGWA